eukprot:scaffold14191_cov97-Skeletonema_dohrnii-CCMP3373.AAC.2
MVTKIVIHIAPAERAVAAVEVSSRDVNRLQNNRRNELLDQSSREEGNQHYSFQGSLNKVTYGGICDGHSYHDNASPRVKDDGKAADMRWHNNSKKRPLLLDDKGDAEKKKRRKKGQTKFVVDLTGVPAQPPILKSSRKNGTSKYQGVSFYKATKKWKAQIAIDRKQHHIGYYANEEDAGIDYARAVFKYNSNSIRKRKPFCPLGPLPLPDPKEMEERHRKALAFVMMSDQDREKVKRQWRETSQAA